MSYLNIVEPLEGIGQVAPVVAVVVAAGRKSQKDTLGSPRVAATISRFGGQDSLSTRPKISSNFRP